MDYDANAYVDTIALWKDIAKTTQMELNSCQRCCKNADNTGDVNSKMNNLNLSTTGTHPIGFFLQKNDQKYDFRLKIMFGRLRVIGSIL